MKIEYLYDIIALNDKNSFKEAAKDRGISEATLKKHLEIIEVEIGDKIYRNKESYIELTAEGISLYLYAVKALSKITGYKNKNFKKVYTKTISIGVDVNIFIGYICICSKLVGEQFNININILQLYNNYILDGIKAGKYDAGLVIIDKLIKEKAKSYNLQYESICTRRPVIIVSENHPLAQLNKVSLKDLKSYKRVSLRNSFEEFSCFEQDIEAKYGLKRSNIIFKYISDILMALRNSEFYFLGGINEDEEAFLEEFKVIEIEELTERMEVGYIYPREKPLLEPIKAIVDIRETFKNH